MILDLRGNSADGESARKAEMIESTASFAYDLDIKKPDGTSAYEKARFFRSHKFRCKAEHEDEASREAFEWCVDEVMEDIRGFNERRARKLAGRAA